ncbi:MAG: GNAT family N-acetyltransferase [Vicingaceae bacterium]|jgi:ribosomal protein S18 acetylase RimI-like enzyme
MIKIIKATENDASILSNIGRQSFIQTHQASASENVINSYVDDKLTLAIFTEELSDSSNHYYLIYYKNKIAGYSKIIMDSPHPNINLEKITKLERLYLLQEFYDYKLGYELFKFNITLSKKNNESGMWLFVWKENERAINFYKKTGFKIIGSHDFELSKDHSNPNHQMLLMY